MDLNTGQLIGRDADDPNPQPVDVGHEAYTPPDPFTPPTTPADPDNDGPFDAATYGTDAKGRPVNRHGRYEGQAADEAGLGRTVAIERWPNIPDGDEDQADKRDAPLPQDVLDEIEAAELAPREEEL